MNSRNPTEQIRSGVDDYLNTLYAPPEVAPQAALEASIAAGLPAIHVPPTLGKFLQLLLRIHGSKRVLEVGTLGGYSTIWMVAALPDDGRLITLEANEHHADVARKNIEQAGHADRVEVIVGPALESLDRMIAENAEPFDFVFLDADKPNNPHYLERSLQLTRPGSVIVGDNVIRNGAVLDADSDDPTVVGIRRFNEMLATDPRLTATAIPTIGAKGYDGFAVAVVK